MLVCLLHSIVIDSFKPYFLSLEYTMLHVLVQKLLHTVVLKI